MNGSENIPRITKKNMQKAISAVIEIVFSNSRGRTEVAPGAHILDVGEITAAIREVGQQYGEDTLALTLADALTACNLLYYIVSEYLNMKRLPERTREHVNNVAMGGAGGMPPTFPFTGKLARSLNKRDAFLEEELKKTPHIKIPKNGGNKPN